jgi:hypothetical protein
MTPKPERPQKSQPEDITKTDAGIPMADIHEAIKRREQADAAKAAEQEEPLTSLDDMAAGADKAIANLEKMPIQDIEDVGGTDVTLEEEAPRIPLENIARDMQVDLSDPGAEALLTDLGEEAHKSKSAEIAGVNTSLESILGTKSAFEKKPSVGSIITQVKEKFGIDLNEDGTLAAGNVTGANQMIVGSVQQELAHRYANERPDALIKQLKDACGVTITKDGNVPNGLFNKNQRKYLKNKKQVDAAVRQIQAWNQRENPMNIPHAQQTGFLGKLASSRLGRILGFSAALGGAAASMDATPDHTMHGARVVSTANAQNAKPVQAVRGAFVRGHGGQQVIPQEHISVSEGMDISAPSLPALTVGDQFPMGLFQSSGTVTLGDALPHEIRNITIDGTGVVTDQSSADLDFVPTGYVVKGGRITKIVKGDALSQEVQQAHAYIEKERFKKERKKVAKAIARGTDEHASAFEGANADQPQQEERDRKPSKAQKQASVSASEMWQTPAVGKAPDFRSPYDGEEGGVGEGSGETGQYADLPIPGVGDHAEDAQRVEKEFSSEVDRKYKQKPRDQMADN